MLRTLLVAAALAVATIPAQAGGNADIDAGIARLCGADAGCRANQHQAFAAFQARARADAATAPRSVKLVMFECFLATGHAERAAEGGKSPTDWQVMLACYQARMP